MGDPMIDAVQPKQTSVITPTTVSTTPTAPTTTTTTQPKSPGKFGRIFGGILGGAMNIMAPGAGALIGSFIRGGMGGPDMVGVETMLAHSAQQQMQMIALQNRVQTSAQEFATVSNLLKARHDGEMDAIRNFKS